MADELICGFIGLGSQGAPIARRMINANFSTMLWARRDETLKSFRDTPAKISTTIDELAMAVNYVGICVSGDESVTQIGEQLISAMKPGSLIVLHSTVLPQTAKALAIKAAKKELLFLDAPVSGGQPAADKGDLTVMLGGSDKALELAKPILKSFSSSMIHLGDVGAAQMAKLINNSLMVANMGLAHSALLAGIESGLDKDKLLELLLASSGGSFGLGVYARHSDIANFERLEQLLEKVELLGRAIGTDHPSYNDLHKAALKLKC